MRNLYAYNNISSGVIAKDFSLSEAGRRIANILLTSGVTSGATSGVTSGVCPISNKESINSSFSQKEELIDLWLATY